MNTLWNLWVKTSELWEIDLIDFGEGKTYPGLGLLFDTKPSDVV